MLPSSSKLVVGALLRAYLGHACTPVKNVERGGERVLNALESALAPVGLNLLGVASVAAYDATVPAERALRRLLPEAQSAIVIGNGGAEFWHAFRDFCRRHPGHERSPDPLDGFTRRVVEEAATPLLEAEPARFLYPFRFATEPVAFLHLAASAGLGTPSLVGVLVHPRFGPWMALRAAILVTRPLEASRPADGFDPCPTCRERTCIAACRVDAVTPAGWDVPRCAAYRLAPDDACAPRCHARYECVLGREHRYPVEAMAHHQRYARIAMASAARSGC
jgi:hypothetical protein